MSETLPTTVSFEYVTRLRDLHSRTVAAHAATVTLGRADDVRRAAQLRHALQAQVLELTGVTRAHWRIALVASWLGTTSASLAYLIGWDSDAIELSVSE